MGHWLLAWLCGSAAICASTPYALHFTLKATATTPLSFRLIAVSHHHLYALISLPARGSVLTQMPQADAGAVRSSAGQNRHPRPKGDKCSEWFEEHYKFDRRERSSMKGSKNIEIYLVQRTAKAGRKISGQTGVAMFTSATYVWTFIWRCLNEMWHQHQIYPIPISSLFLNIFVALIEGVFLYKKQSWNCL
jgi:hypothetical protein